MRFDSNKIDINNAVLVWARESLAMSRNMASEKSGISIKKLIQLEDGEISITMDELKSLSKVYKRTMATLLLDTPPKEKPLPLDRRTLNSKEIGALHEKTIMAVRKARALVQSYVELHSEFGLSLPKLTLHANISENPKEVASKIRRMLNLRELHDIENSNLALEACIEKVESIGVAVFQLSLTQDNIRGFSITDEILPIIGIKRGGESANAKIFTLSHELGHVLLNEGGMCDMSDKSQVQIEKWCNAFAAEVIIPQTELLKLGIVIEKSEKQDKYWSKKELIEMGREFHAGPLAVLRALLEINLTTPAYYSDRHEAWNKPSFGRSKLPEGRNIAKETIREKGRLYVNLAFRAYDQNRIDLKDLSDFLGVKLAYIDKTRQLLNT